MGRAWASLGFEHRARSRVEKRCKLSRDAVVDGTGRASLPAPGEVDWFVIFWGVEGDGRKKRIPWWGSKAMVREQEGATLQGREASDITGIGLELSQPGFRQRTVTGRNSRQAVRPRREIGGRSMRCNASVQELGQTVKDAAVVRVGKGCSEGRWQCPENILAPGAGTVEQQEPRDLEVWDRRKGLEESTMLRGKSLEIRNNEFVCAEGRSKDPQATFIGWQAGVADPGVLWVWGGRQVGGFDPTRIPDLRLGGIEADAGMFEQVTLEALKQMGGAPWGTCQVDIIKECSDMFVREELVLKCI